MRESPLLPIVIVALAAAPLGAPLGAQLDRPRVAFEPALTPWIGVRNFGTRVVDPIVGSYKLKGSLALGLRGDRPLTRRTGLLVDLSVAPLSGQEGAIRGGSTTFDADIIVLAADIGIGGRLKPAAPVFFYVGGGVLRASKYAIPRTPGAPVEPQGSFAVGYDGAQHGRWNFRAVYGGHFVRPADPGTADASGKSLAYDWDLQLGARYAFRRVSPDGSMR
jgi:hypothetical protein